MIKVIGAWILMVSAVVVGFFIAKKINAGIADKIVDKTISQHETSVEGFNWHPVREYPDFEFANSKDGIITRKKGESQTILVKSVAEVLDYARSQTQAN